MLSIIMLVVGFVSGMYVATQIEKSIDKNIVNETIKEELEGRSWMNMQDIKQEIDRQDDIEQDHITRKNEDYD